MDENCGEVTSNPMVKQDGGDDDLDESNSQRNHVIGGTPVLI